MPSVACSLRKKPTHSTIYELPALDVIYWQGCCDELCYTNADVYCVQSAASAKAESNRACAENKTSSIPAELGCCG